MKNIFIVIFSIVPFFGFSQKKPKEVYLPLVPKQTLNLSFALNPMLVIDDRPGGFGWIYGFVVKPKINYFVLNKVSVGISYTGIFLSIPKIPQYKFYKNNIDAELNWFLYDKRKTLVYLIAGASYGQNLPYKNNEDNFSLKKPGSLMKFGVGISFRFRRIKNLSINVEYNQYFNLTTPKSKYASGYGGYPIGISYYFLREKKQ